MEKGRDVPGRSDGVSVGPGQLGFTCAVAAETAEGLKKPEGGTGEEVAFLASRGRRELGHGRTGHPELERRRDEESQERHSTRAVGASRRAVVRSQGRSGGVPRQYSEGESNSTRGSVSSSR